MKNLSPSKIKVLHIVSSLGMGGAEIWLYQMVKYWSNFNGNKPIIDFLVTSGRKGVLDNEIEALGAKIYYFELKAGTLFPFTASLRKLLYESNYSCIHNHQHFYSGWHFLFSVGLIPKKRIVHIHNSSSQLLENYGNSFKKRLHLKIGKQLTKLLASHILGTSEQILQEYKITKSTYKNQLISPLYCGFPIENWKGNHLKMKLKLCQELNWPTNCKVILFAGRLDPSTDVDDKRNQKNSTYALNIIKACQQYYEDIRLVMVGYNTHIKEEYLNLIKEMDLFEKVALTGIRKDLNEIMLAANLLLFPSKGEGLGMVAVESQAAGLPVLASSAVPKECVVLEELVTFFSLNNSYQAWALKIQEIIFEPRGNSTYLDDRWKSSPFNIEVCARSLEAIYHAP